MTDMTFTQLRDVFEHVKRVHYQAGECCARATDPRDPRLGLLLGFFRQWDERLGNCFEAYQEAEGKKKEDLLETWVQFTGMQNVDRALAAVESAQDDTAAALVRSSLDLQEAIIGLFEQLAGAVTAPHVRQQLLSLVEFERRAAEDLGTALLTQNDA